MSYRAEDFRIDMRKSTVPEKHLWVNSGYTTCAPQKGNVAGVSGCFAPPVAAEDTAFSISMEADGHRIEDALNYGKGDVGLLYAGAFWQPDKILRKGTYHHMVGEKLVSLGVESQLVPLYGKAGYLMVVRVENRAKEQVTLKVDPLLTPGHPRMVDLDLWDFMPPQGAEKEVPKVAENLWENDDIRVSLFTEGFEDKVLEEKGVYECRAAVVFTKAGEAAPEGKRLSDWQEETERVWRERLELAGSRIPEIDSNIPGLCAYYRVSLISGLVCLWENDAYVMKPFPATSGMDGGSICCYPWDVAGYSARTLIMLLGDKTHEFLLRMLESGIDSHICMSLTGKGQGWCGYSYSMWSLINLYWNIVTMTGRGLELFDRVVKLFEQEEKRLPEWRNLKDYGRQHNLLEMRGCGYEYYVPSPNAERAWCYDRLADIAALLGRGDMPGWRKKAEAIRTSVKENLWDEEKGWFKCIHPDHVEYVYSVQAYDAMRMGACDEHMIDALIAHLVDGKFLGEYGVSSVSAEDGVHYEVNDPDWSGSGSYSGEGPELAEALWNNGRPKLAYEVLKRHFWQGKMLPYIPQEHSCDTPTTAPNKRANIIAGVVGLQAVLFGLAGIKPELDGKLVVEPKPLAEGWLQVKGYRHRGKTVDIWFDASRMKVTVDGGTVYDGIPGRFVVES